MATVFQRNGRWHAKIKDERGRWATRSCGTADKATSKAWAADWEKKARDVREGRVDPKAEAYALAEATPLAEHVDAYAADMVARGASAKHCRNTIQRVRRVMEIAELSKLSAITPAAINNAVKVLRDGGMAKAGLCHNLRAVKMFSRWLWRNGKMRDDALASVKVGTVQKSERVRRRRALSREEFAVLLATIEKAEVSFCMSGSERAMLYKAAVGTGLRVKELASLTPERFDLEAEGGPAVRVVAAYSKRRRDDRQPITVDLAEALAVWLKGKPAKSPVFNLPSSEHTAEMFRADVRLARAKWIRAVADRKERRERRKSDFLAVEDKSGARLDFHALRHTYITWIVSSGAAVSVVQAMARHSTPTLTFGVYSHVTLADESRALAALPVFGTPKPTTEKNILRATGTDDVSPHQTNTETSAPRAHQIGRENVRTGANECNYGAMLRLAPSIDETPEFTGSGELLRVGAGISDTGRSGIRTRDKRICNPPHWSTLASGRTKKL